MIETPDPCTQHGTCNQHCNQGRQCPRRTQAAQQQRTIGATPVRPSNLHYLHPQPAPALPAARHTPMPKITGSKLADDDDTTGRVIAVYDAIGTLGQVLAILLTIVIVGVASGYVATRWGDSINQLAAWAHQVVWHGMLAWGRVWT